VWICSISSSSADTIDRSLRSPIYDPGSRPWASAAFEILSATIHSKSFTIVFKRAIGRNALAAVRFLWFPNDDCYGVLELFRVVVVCEVLLEEPDKGFCDGISALDEKLVDNLV
jgi:hypothetical protein